MRSDEQLLQDEIESTTACLYETAYRLYEAIGPSAVLSWGFSIGLRTSFCRECEDETPDLPDSEGVACAVCGCLKGSGY